MKFAITLNVLVAINLFGIGDASTSTGIAALDDLQNTVDVTIDNLMCYHENLTLILASDAENFKISSLERIDQIVDEHLSTLWILYGGHVRKNDAEKCMTMAEHTSRRIENATLNFSHIDGCSASVARDLLDEIAYIIEKPKRTGAAITTELIEILKDCASSNRGQLENCVKPKLSGPRQSVHKLLEYDADARMEVYADLTKASEDCLQDLIKMFHRECRRVHQDMWECLKLEVKFV